MLYYITCKKFPTILISGKKSVRNFYESEILTLQYNTFKYFIGRRHQAKYTCHIHSQNSDQASVILYITGKETFCGFKKKKTMYKYISFCMHKKLHILSHAQWRCQCQSSSASSSVMNTIDRAISSSLSLASDSSSSVPDS